MIYKYFLPFHRLALHFVDVVFPLLCRSFLQFDVVALVYFYFCCLCFLCKILKITAKTNVKELTPYIFYKCYGFKFNIQVFNLFWVDFYVWCKTDVLFHCLYVAIQFSQHQLLKKLSFPHWVFLAPLSNIVDQTCTGLVLCFIFYSIEPCVFLRQYHTAWVLQHCNTIWNREVWCLQLCSSCSRLLWLLWVF